MPAPTRKRYVEYEIAARSSLSRRIAEREAIRRWNSWPASARTILIREFDTLTAAQAHTDTAVADLDAITDRATRIAHQGLPSAARITRQAVEACFTCSQAMYAEMGNANVLVQFFEALQCPQEVIDRAVRARERADRHRDSLLQHTLTLMHMKDQAADMHKYRSRGQLVKTHVSPLNSWEHSNSAYVRQPLLGLAPDVNTQGRGWSGPYLIWQGGNNICTAYVDTDRYERIIDRFIRKDVVVGEHSWRDVSRWDGDVRDIHNRTAWEVACHRALHRVQSSSIPGQSNILGFRGHGINLARQTYTVFTDVADSGTADDVMQQYVGEKIPEPFLFYMFEVLIECGLAMQFGAVDGDVDPDWREVVHVDIKPSNTFLGEPSSTIYPRYPAPKLGDFGASFRTYPGDPANPNMYANGFGTEGYRAPEAMRLRKAGPGRDAVDKYELGSHTNVYQVGRTMVAMMLNNDFIADPNFTQDLEGMASLPLDDENRLYRRCHPEFVDLVLACLAPVPDNRATFTQLHDRLRALLEREDDDQILNAVRSMRNGTADAWSRMQYDLMTWDPSRLGSRRLWAPRFEQFALGRDMGIAPGPIMTSDSQSIGRW